MPLCEKNSFAIDRSRGPLPPRQPSGNFWPRKPVQTNRFLRTSLTSLAVLAVAVFAGCPSTQTPAPVDTIDVQSVAGGFASPVALAFADDGSNRLFIVDQIGQISILNSAGELESTPFLDIRSKLVSLNPAYDERGLLGLAFHPKYASNGRFFVAYSSPGGAGTPTDFDSEVHLSEFFVSATDPNVADPDSERLLLSIPHPQPNHDGGQLAFGPDGLLYFSMGDGGGGNDVGAGHTTDTGNAQDPSKFLGKILRIDVDAGDPYGIPTDNPFAADSTYLPEIWAYGFRNPWRFSFDRGGTHRLFVGDVGQALFEEIDIVTEGGDYGWNIREGFHCFDPSDAGTPPQQCAETGPRGEPLLDPILEVPHTDSSGHHIASAIIGGFVYRGATIAGLRGRYVFADFSAQGLPDGSLFVASEAADGSWTSNDLGVGKADGRLGRYVLGLGEDATGELYVLTSRNLGLAGSSGEVLKIISAGQ